VDIGLAVFSPSREYTVTGNPSGYEGTFGLTPGNVESDSNYFFIPSFAWNKILNENSAIGIALYGNGGMNTDYPTQTFYDQSSSTTGVDLMQLFIAPTYAYKFAGKHSFGITPIIAAQLFEAKGVQSFQGYSWAPDKLSGNDHDTAWGFGGRIGYLGQFNEKFSLGLSYQSKIYMQEFDDYAGLFAEQGDFDIPANWTVGIAIMPTPAVTVAFDVQQIYYSDIDSIANPLLPNLGMPGGGLGTDNGAGFGWEDMTVFKVGLQWARTDEWTYRFGYSYGEQPIPDAEVLFNILAPGVVEQHATFGFTYTFANASELDFSFMYAFDKSVSGPNSLEAPDQQTIELSMSQWEVGVGYSWKF
jgi:long-chain fatty acid transport protein